MIMSVRGALNNKDCIVWAYCRSIGPGNIAYMWTKRKIMSGNWDGILNMGQYSMYVLKISLLSLQWTFHSLCTVPVLRMENSEYFDRQKLQKPIGLLRVTQKNVKNFQKKRSHVVFIESHQRRIIGKLMLKIAIGQTLYRTRFWVSYYDEDRSPFLLLFFKNF